MAKLGLSRDLRLELLALAIAIGLCLLGIAILGDLGLIPRLEDRWGFYLSSALVGASTGYVLSRMLRTRATRRKSGP